MPNTFTLQVNRRDPRPRSPRLRSLGAGASASSVSAAAVPGGQQPLGDGHTHANKATLDQFSTDEQRYLCLRWLIDVYDELTGQTTSQSIDERVRAGFADLANRAIDLTENSPVFGYFLSKIKADTAAGRITFEQGLIAIGTVLANAATFRGNVDLQGNLDVAGQTDYGHSLVPGTSGAGIWKDDQDNWHAQFDFLRINKKLEALEVEIQKMSHIGGALVLSATRCTIRRTEQLDGGSIIRCYFPATDSDPDTGRTRSITNNWKPLDQARCQTFNLVTDPQTGMTTNRYWWRLVQATGTTADGTEHYIDFDISDVSQGQPSLADTAHAAAGSCVPEAGDNVVLCGSRAILSDGSGDYDLARQNVIILDAAGEGSPYIRIYNAIRTFNLGRARLDLNPQNPRLDVGELTITSTDGSTKDVAEVIDESFLVWYVTVDAPTDTEGLILATVPLGHTAFPDTINGWNAADLATHQGDVALTADGVCYRLEAISASSYAWQRKADDFLIDALQTANRAAQTLSDMADDNVITRQEKLQLRTLRTQIDQEKEQIVAEASSLTSVSSASYVSAYNALRAFLTYLINDTADTPLVRTSDGYTLYAAEAYDLTDVRTYSVAYSDLSSSHILAGKTYPRAISDYYARLAALRRSITAAVRSEIQTSSATAYDDAVNAYVNYLRENLDTLVDTRIAGNSSISQFTSLYSTLSNWNWGTDADGNPTVNGAGLLTTSNFASLWASQFVGDTQVASAILSAFCENRGTAEAPQWVSSIGISATYFVVDTQNFKVDEDGNVKVTGEVTARRFVNEMVTIPPLYDSQSGDLVSTINLVRLLADADGSPYWYYDSSAAQRKPFLVGTARNFIIDADALQFRLTVWFPDSNQMERLCPSGTRLLFYNKSFRYGSQGQMATTSLVEFWHGELDTDHFQGSIPFRGISMPYEYSGSDIVPIEAYSFEPVSSITIGNGIVEFMSMPVGDGKVEWVVTRISATYQALSFP